MVNIFSGDPALEITKNGSRFNFIDGQPVMDGGFENAVLISLFTKENWAGNDLFDVADEKIGSDFEESLKEPINLDGLNKRRQAAIRALQWLIDNGSFKAILINITNPTSTFLLMTIKITPPNGEDVFLTLENFGANWQIQKTSPAHRRVL